MNGMNNQQLTVFTHPGIVNLLCLFRYGTYVITCIILLVSKGANDEDQQQVGQIDPFTIVISFFILRVKFLQASTC